jgi:hypothetical protein
LGGVGPNEQLQHRFTALQHDENISLLGAVGLPDQRKAQLIDLEIHSLFIVGADNRNMMGMIQHRRPPFGWCAARIQCVPYKAGSARQGCRALRWRRGQCPHWPGRIEKLFRGDFFLYVDYKNCTHY